MTTNLPPTPLAPRTGPRRSRRSSLTLWTWIFATGLGLVAAPSRAVVTEFFNASQTTNLVESGATWDILSSEGYLFTCSRDKLFTGGVGLTNPVGRMLRVVWPQGLEAQAITSGPNPGGARFTVERVDGAPFDIHSLSARLLANTSGAGAAFEVMPILNGEDALNDPIQYNANGNYGTTFTYRTTALTNYEGYRIGLYVDFAIVGLTTIDATVPPPRLEIQALPDASIAISWPAEATGYRLEGTEVLPAQRWSEVTEPQNVEGDLITVIIPASASARFFRLAK